MYIDFYSANGIPQTLVVSLTVLLFLITLSPIFSGAKVLNLDFPELTRFGKLAATLIGAPGLFLVILGFQLKWVDQNMVLEHFPFCQIAHWKVDERTFRVDWLVDSKSSASVSVTKDGSILENKQSGQRDFAYRDLQGVTTLKVVGTNRYGNCSEAISIWDPSIDYSVPLECILKIDQATAKEGEKYKLSWTVTGPEFFLVYINGARVSETDSASFVFTGPNYDRFRLSANAGGNTCQQDAIILRE